MQVRLLDRSRTGPSVRKELDADGDGDGDYEQKRVFAYDGNQIVLDCQHTGAGDAAASDLRWRYLWGPAVDQILAEEEVDGGTDDMVQWMLTDHLNTVRDIAKYDPLTDTTTVVNHLVYDAFANVTRMGSRRREPAVDSPFLFTARPFDADTGLQNNLNRWYDPAVGSWLSEDPIGFAAGDPNLYPYVHNGPTFATDPTGKVWWNPYCLEPLNVFVAHSCCLACRWSLDVRDSATEARLGQAFADRVNSDRASGVNIALRHCFASALLAVKEGCNCAGCIGDARERYQTWCQGQSEQNRQIVNYNNWRGRQCAGCSGESARHGRSGGDVASIMKCCLKKLGDGELFVPGGGSD